MPPLPLTCASVYVSVDSQRLPLFSGSQSISTTLHLVVSPPVTGVRKGSRDASEKEDTCVSVRGLWLHYDSWQSESEMCGPAQFI